MLMNKVTDYRAMGVFLVVSTQRALTSSPESACHVRKLLVHGSNIPGGHCVVG